jgi:hypothetical protein
MHLPLVKKLYTYLGKIQTLQLKNNKKALPLPSFKPKSNGQEEEF